MNKTILITGATDGIGFETAKRLASGGHTLLLHGRSDDKLAKTAEAVSAIPNAGKVTTYRADLSDLNEVNALGAAVAADVQSLDVLINNAGVFVLSNPLTASGHDLRFIVNTVAPYVLTQRLMPVMQSGARVVNLSSAAQAPVNLDALSGAVKLSDNEAYAQSKLAITMWSAFLAQQLSGHSPAIIAVNPASFLGSKMVKEAYGREGQDLGIGADILARAGLSDEFSDASGLYFDNDRGAFAQPHPDASDAAKCSALVVAIEQLISELTSA